MGVASRTIGGGVLLVADALAEAKRCGQELSTAARSGSSGSISSLLSENITDDMESLELSKTSIPFVFSISVWSFSIAGGQGSPKIMRPPSYVFISSSLGPGAWNVPVMD